MSRQRPPDHHGIRGLIDHFITQNKGRHYHRRFGRRLLRQNATTCDRCITADNRDARLRHIHTAYRRRR